MVLGKIGTDRVGRRNRYWTGRERRQELGETRVLRRQGVNGGEFGVRDKRQQINGFRYRANSVDLFTEFPVGFLTPPPFHIHPTPSSLPSPPQTTSLPPTIPPPESYFLFPVPIAICGNTTPHYNKNYYLRMIFDEDILANRIEHEVERSSSCQKLENKGTGQSFQSLDPKAATPPCLSGHWNLEESQRYYVFLTLNRRNFQKKGLRRSQKIFKQMSKFVRTRTADQCRSHHQKMEKKYETLNQIYAVHQKCFSMNPPLLEELTRECRSLQKSGSGFTGYISRGSKEEVKGFVGRIKEQEGARQPQRRVPDMSVYYQNGYYVMPVFVLPCSQNYYFANCLDNLTGPSDFKFQQGER